MNTKHVTITFLSSTLIYLSLGSCKTMPDSKLQGVLEENDMARVNEPISRALIRSDANLWSAYQNDHYAGVSNEEYEKNWNIYQKFLLGDPSKPTTMKCVRHKVHFIFEPVATTKPTKSEPKVANTNNDPQVQNCSQANHPSAKILSYRLYNYRQPNLSRNLLALAKAGFFNGKAIQKWKKYDILPMVGEHTADQDPFFLSPDDKYTVETAQQDFQKIYSNPEDPSAQPFFNEKQYYDKLPPVTSRLSLLAVIRNNSINPTDFSRSAVPFRVAFSNITSGAQEARAGFSKTKTFPIAFGELIVDPKFAKQNLSSTKELLDLNKQQPLQVSCVAIEYSIEDYLEDDHLCPEVLAK